MNPQIQVQQQVVPLLDLSVTYEKIREELEAVVLSVMEDCHYINGPQVTKLENRIAAYSNTVLSVGVASGSDALLLALMVLDIGPGDEVITTPFTFFATAGSIARLGAVPVFVDIDPKTFNLIPEQVKAKITNKTKAIMPVHIFGQCAEMGSLMTIAKKNNLPVIEDAAQAIGATYKGKKAGSMGDFGCFSFFPSKNLGGMGDGGIITTNNGKYAKLIRSLKDHGSTPKDRHCHKLVGCNSRLDTLQAAVLLVKLNYLDRWHESRRENAALYDRMLADVPQVTTPYISPDCESIYNQYSLIVEKRDELKAFLATRNIASAVYYPRPLHLQKCFSNLGYKSGDFPNAEFTAEHVLSLPVYPGLTEEMIEQVVNGIKEFYRQ